MITGVKEVTCTCSKQMIRTGGVFNAEPYASTDTYFCNECKKHIIVITPKQEVQVVTRQQVAKNIFDEIEKHGYTDGMVVIRIAYPETNWYKIWRENEG